MARDVKNMFLRCVFVVVLKRFCVLFLFFLWHLLSTFNTGFEHLNHTDTLNGHEKMSIHCS